MRKEMEHRLRLPPRLVVIKNVFGKTACVQNSKMRTDAWPRIRRGLAAIIKAGPVECARQKLARGENPPPSFCRRCISGVIHVVSADVTFQFIVGVNAAGEIFTAHFRSDGWQLRKL